MFWSIWYNVTGFVVIKRQFVCTNPVVNVSDSVTRVTIFLWLGLDLSHVEKNGDSTGVTFFTEWLDSSHNQWLETRVRVFFTKSLNLWWTNPVHLRTKKWASFALAMIKIIANFLSCLSSPSMLHFKHQVSPTCTEVEQRHFFHWEVSRAQYIDTLSWFNVLFAYSDHDSGSHTATFSLFQIPLKWFKFFRFKSNPKIILQNIMRIRKPNHI